MTALPVVVILTAASALGLYLGLLFLRGERRPTLIAFHLLLGFGGLETLVMLLHGTPNGAEGASNAASLGTIAAGLFAVSAFSGFVAALARRSPVAANVVLGTHVTVGLAGFALFLAWVSNS
ncbi:MULTISPECIES: hypothetical protein [Rhodopseudomonas]|uniref:Uncharacterized protein n=1 Tax=Rhodopseudomonas palustris TaxID=1076 RepID=A0A0D7EJI5_RHOPL|nr:MULTISPECIES: hypothetical protein [Rhodopseudomonas]KIZ40999.1 hypothetical protein OO17_16245 [Rhodopseudomonas palustris]MDF3813478.1 hypothetical protein [Rhodopseudomonas sp. BAL398]WOK18694.1 hypothetical protein RBJ75_03975 [Rhodopseudomonas sp. BAL398]